MFQILSLNSDLSTPNFIGQAFRGFFSLIDMSVYSLVVVVYEILFNIADSTFFSSQTIKDFYGRIQLILGVFMIFKLSISLLQAVINPDYLTDQKKGMGKIITRIIMMLAMFTAIIPLNIPLTQTEINEAKNSNNVKSFNYQLNQNGLLFGTMYSLQERILKGNVLGKLVFGGKDNERFDIGDDEDSEENNSLKDSANKLAVYLLKAFVRINLKPDAEGKGKITTNDYICESYSPSEQSQINRYISGEDGNDVTVDDVINPDNMTEYCNDGSLNPNRWMFTYLPIVSTVCGVILLVILIGYCIDIAIRTLKLAILRLIAPIPIISYIDPKSSENGSFAAWTKALISTYIDLFIRLLIIYFVIFLVQEICDYGLSLPITNGVVGIISTVFIIIGLFFFAKVAPKFVRDALGLKGLMSNVGLSGILGATGALMGGGGIGAMASGALSAMNNHTEAQATGKQAPGAYSTGSDIAARIRTGDPNAKGGFMNSAIRGVNNWNANRHGFKLAHDEAKKFGDQSHQEQVQIDNLQEALSGKQSELSSLKTAQSKNKEKMAELKDKLQYNYSDDMRNKISSYRRQYPNATNADIFADARTHGWASDADINAYFADEKALALANSNASSLENQISSTENEMSTIQSEISARTIRKRELDYHKGKAEESISKMEKIHQNVGNIHHEGDSNYESRKNQVPDEIPPSQYSR